MIKFQEVSVRIGKWTMYSCGRFLSSVLLTLAIRIKMVLVVLHYPICSSRRSISSGCLWELVNTNWKCFIIYSHPTPSLKVVMVTNTRGGHLLEVLTIVMQWKDFGVLGSWPLLGVGHVWSCRLDCIYISFTWIT